MKRITDLFLIVLLLVSVLPMSGLAAMKETNAESNVYTLMKSADLTDTAIEDRGPLGFWGQSGIKRQDVEVITFLDSTETAPRYVYDFSEKADQSILGWIVNGELFVATEGRNLIYLDISGFTGKRLSSTTKMFLNVGNLKTFYCNDETIIRAYRSK